MYKKFYRDPLDQDTINMIGEAIISKERNLQYYQWIIDNISLIDLSPVHSITETQANELMSLMKSIRDEELKHSLLLQNLYLDLAGNYAPTYKGVFVPPSNFISGLEYAIEVSLDSIKKYKLLMNKLQNPKYKESISSVITDEFNHTNTYYSLLQQFANIV